MYTLLDDTEEGSRANINKPDTETEPGKSQSYSSTVADKVKY